jgi:broad specificity phosphatase PhoE
VATTIVLARHGETDWNRARRFQGHADVPLNAAGRAQAVELATRLEGQRFSAVYTSPLRRAAETAAIVGARLGVQPRPHDALREVDLGPWSGLSEEEVEARFPKGYARWLENRAAGWHDGETYEELAARVVAGLREIARRHPGETLLAITHGGPIRSARASALGLSADEIHPLTAPLGNCATYRIAVRDGNLEAVD